MVLPWDLDGPKISALFTKKVAKNSQRRLGVICGSPQFVPWRHYGHSVLWIHVVKVTGHCLKNSFHAEQIPLTCSSYTYSFFSQELLTRRSVFAETLRLTFCVATLVPLLCCEVHPFLVSCYQLPVQGTWEYPQYRVGQYSSHNVNSCTICGNWHCPNISWRRPSSFTRSYTSFFCARRGLRLWQTLSIGISASPDVNPLEFSA